MKRQMFCLLLCLICIRAGSQTFHAIMFCNTQNPSIGKSVQQDFQKMRIEFKSMANFIGYKYAPYEFKDNKFNRQNLEKTINNLKCGPDDIVFFYYSGHGGRSRREKTDYPQMELLVDGSRGGDERTDLYPLYNVKERIKAKHPRLTIVMGDLCNSYANGITPKEIALDKGPTLKTGGKSQFYKDLFFKMKGDIIATSSKPGETSAAYDFGGAYTYVFLGVLQIMVEKGVDASWETLLENAQYMTNECVKKWSADRAQQHPIFNINSIAGGTQPVTAEPEIDIKDLEGYLTAIGNASTGHLKRIRLIDEALSKYFASPNAKVEVVGKDGQTIVSTKYAKDYLNYLSIAKNLVQVIKVAETPSANGKLIYLKVHEMYQK